MQNTRHHLRNLRTPGSGEIFATGRGNPGNSFLHFANFAGLDLPLNLVVLVFLSHGRSGFEEQKKHGDGEQRHDSNGPLGLPGANVGCKQLHGDGDGDAAGDVNKQSDEGQYSTWVSRGLLERHGREAKPPPL